jgi:hypothetical protein
MAQLLSGTRIYGTGTVDTQLIVSGNTDATSTTTGALTVSGGVGIAKDLYVGGRVYISGTVLSGTQGAQGVQGQATQGTQGVTGQATQGVQGVQGQATQGAQGVTGNATQGTQGTFGNQGVQGAQSLQGTQGVQGVTGTATQGVTGTATQGRQGVQGQATQGTQGVTGQGTQGVQGVTGQATQGVTGQGTQGTTGQGTQGAQSLQGTQGVQGVTGTATQGVTGQGTQGVQGHATQGAQGVTGQATQGVQGVQGAQSLQGTQGVQGVTGTATQGVTGQATQGRQGVQGQATQGTQGVTGTATQGVTGQGTQGTTGSATQGVMGTNGGLNYATSQGWVVGLSGNQPGYYGGDFTLNGSTAENVMAYGTDPFGRRGTLWGARNNNAGSDDDGGWNKTITGVSHLKSYMSVVYVRRNGASTNGSFYHGCDGGNTINLAGGADTNPYFGPFGISTLPQDVWCISIGFIQAYGDTYASSTARGGLYRMDTGQKIVAYTDFRMANGATQQTHRTYLYYSTDAAASLDWWGPGFYEINGNEPNLEQLLGSNNAGWRKSWYAPAYYDSDDINYYLDPNTTGVALRIRGQAYIGPNVSHGRYLRIGGDSQASDEATVATTNGNLHIDSKTGYGLYLNYSSNGDIYSNQGGGIFYNYTSVRSPVFYDFNDTTYYIDINGAYGTNNNGFTAFSKMRLGSTYKFNTARNDYTSDTSYWNGAMGWGVTPLNTVFGWGNGFWDSWGDPANQPAGTSHWNGINVQHSHNGTNGWGWQMTMGAGAPSLTYIRGTWGGAFTDWFKIALVGTNVGSGNFYASKYIDADDTQYYVDPNTETYLYGGIWNNGAHGSSRIINRLLAGNNGAGTGEVRLQMWCSEPGVTWEGAGFGYNVMNDGATGSAAGFGRPNTSFGQAYMRMYSGGQWYFYTTSAAGTRYTNMYLAPNNGVEVYGRLYSDTRVDAPIFYDSKDTSYYVDPYNFSLIRSLYLGAHDSGISEFRFGENTSGWYGDRWYWDSGYNVYRYSRYAGADSLIHYHDTRDTTRITYGRNIVFDNFGKGIVGNYDSYRYQGVFSMGDAYKLPADGTTTGNLYGLAWSHPNALGAASYLGSHGVILLENGNFKGAWGGGSFRTPGRVDGTIFYDWDDTTYYTNPNGSSYVYSLTAASFLRSNGNVLIDANYGYSVMGTYSSTRFQGVWSMGTSWALAVDGTTTGNLYGLAWSYPSAGGAAANLASHGLLCLINGGFASSMSSNIVASSDIRGTIFYDYNNTAYYVDPNSTSQLSTLLVVGDITVGQGQGSSNIYFYDSDEGTRRMHCNSNRIGFLSDANGWGSYCGDGGEWYSDQSVRSPIFYDNNNTGYYTDPASTSNLNSVSMQGGNVYGVMYFHSNRNTTSDSPPLQAYSSNGSGAIMSFHRGGQYAVNFGLDSDNVMRIGGWSASVNRWQLDMSGNMYAAGDVVAYSSDCRLKKNITLIDNPIEMIKRLRGIYFDWEDFVDNLGFSPIDRHEIGVIAQEVQAVIPMAVKPAPFDTGVDGVSVSGKNYITVQMEKIIPLLIESIKEQQEMIEKQNEKISKLELLVEKLLENK